MPATLAKIENELVHCKKCPRLVSWREEVATVKRRAYIDQEYWGKPVPGFGDPKAKLMIVGLAPGAHGSNRTGRMFTGDASGDFLYPALFRAGFANQATATSNQDNLELKDVYISAICRCVPPGNKPTRNEIGNCLPWLEREIESLPNLQGFIALGRIAFEGLLRIIKPASTLETKPKFSHLAYYALNDGLTWILCSYHPSRQNTQTGKLTQEMFDLVWQTAKQKILD